MVLVEKPERRVLIDYALMCFKILLICEIPVLAEALHFGVAVNEEIRADLIGLVAAEYFHFTAHILYNCTVTACIGYLKMGDIVRRGHSVMLQKFQRLLHRFAPVDDSTVQRIIAKRYFLTVRFDLCAACRECDKCQTVSVHAVLHFIGRTQHPCSVDRLLCGQVIILFPLRIKTIIIQQI